MYVDDAFFGADSIQEAVSIAAQFCNFLMAGGFPLRKWAANHPDLLSHLPVDWLAEEPLDESLISQHHPLLGLVWNPLTDSFSFSTDFPKLHEPLTKRQVLSLLAKLYDPLGMLSPLTVRSKIFFQGLWSYRSLSGSDDAIESEKSLNWDDPLPESLAETWKSLYADLQEVQHIQIPRWINHNAGSQVELHGFSDASKDAMAAVVYLRVLNDEKVSVSLLAAKTKVTPVKTLSTPRLELCAAVLLAKLVSSIQKALHLENQPAHLWSDSSVALSWICSSPHLWQVFVANRTAEIDSLMPSARWHHIDGEINPADAPSRGISASELIASQLWWKGPEFLETNTQSYFEEFSSSSFSSCPAHVVMKNPIVEPEIISAFSTFNRLIRVVSWIRRFVSNVRSRMAKTTTVCSENLLVSELKETEIMCIKLTQLAYFSKEYLDLSRDRSLHVKSAIINLCPFLEPSSQCIRLGGRLKHANISENEKHPFILPSNSHLSKLIARSYHLRCLHGGTQLTLSLLREKYWIVHSRRLVKSVISKCPSGIRHRGQFHDSNHGKFVIS